VTDPSRRLAPVVRVAPAKVNLTLAVLARRVDGYHDLHSVVTPLALADRLSLAIDPGATQDTLHVTGRNAGPVADNLVLRAIAAARRAAAPLAGGPGRLPPLAARLDKLIPVAAGLGGGSSDAAAAIDGALEAWGMDLPLAERTQVAAGVGSDVPLFLVGGPVLMEGRGERVTPLEPLRGPSPAVLLVVPAVAVSTASVFELFALGGRPSGSTRLASEHLAQELRTGLGGGDLVARAGVLASANDLVPAATTLEPGLVPFRRRVMRTLARPVGLSGSGPALWALYPSLEQAEEAGSLVRAALASGALEPLGGAEPSIHATTMTPAQGRNP
jgi:4-diphosphocytidyl-2-C-methyl-D-erythritol kinase